MQFKSPCPIDISIILDLNFLCRYVGVAVQKCGELGGQMEWKWSLQLIRNFAQVSKKYMEMIYLKCQVLLKIAFDISVS